MITLTLVHPLKNLPSQSWAFENESVIRIGRSPDNDVVLHSVVVSRHHVELQRRGCNWNIRNLGSNGTYLADLPITQAQVEDGTIVQLARSGPRIKIQMGTTDFKNVTKPRSTNGMQAC